MKDFIFILGLILVIAVGCAQTGERVVEEENYAEAIPSTEINEEESVFEEWSTFEEESPIEESEDSNIEELAPEETMSEETITEEATTEETITEEVIEAEDTSGILSAQGQDDIFDDVYNDASINKDGLRIINYDQFMDIKKSDDDYVILDSRTSDEFNSGHIEGSINFPVQKITQDSVLEKIPEGSNVITYHKSSTNPKSTRAGEKLSEFESDYKVLVFEGGIKELEEKGVDLVN